MRTTWGLVTLAALPVLLAAPRADADPIYSLRLFNTDDTLSAYITNASFTNQPILTNTFGMDTGFVDISSYVSAGENTVELRLSNTLAGYTYGYDLERNGVSMDAGSCGTTNVAGCHGNDTATGTVFVHTLTFGLPPAQTPDALRLYNTDDTLQAFVTNAAFSGQLVLSNGYNMDTGFVDISSITRPGDNRFDLVLSNSDAGYTYGYQFASGGALVDAATCGTTGVAGCNDNNLAQGAVFTHTLLFQAPQTVPEPSPLFLLGAGLLAVRRRLRSRR